MRALTITTEHWPLAGVFNISRGSKSEAVTITVTISDGAHIGRGECVPYARYGETAEKTAATLQSIPADITRDELQNLLRPGAARNALDCALWDLEAKQSGKHVHELAGLPAPQAVTTARTISLAAPEEMEKAAASIADWPLLKIKLGADDVEACLKAARRGAAKARLIVDANESWAMENLAAHIDACKAVGVELIEQPLPADKDALLASVTHPIPLCADESAHDRASLASLAGKYEWMNIKLDKAGGLTEALATAKAARAAGFKIMAGCMIASSLAVAPALLLAQNADIVDLDAPLWLARDREHALRFARDSIAPPPPELWG